MRISISLNQKIKQEKTMRKGMNFLLAVIAPCLLFSHTTAAGLIVITTTSYESGKLPNFKWIETLAEAVPE